MTDLSVTSGLNIAQSTLDTIASNVANVSTPGYKAGSYSFLATLSASADAVLSDPSSGVIQRFSQGGIATTGNPLNAAINGQGFFQVTNSNDQTSYTRNGEFAIGSKSALQLVNGSNVMGYNADGEGKILPTLTSITLDQTPLPPSATTSIGMNVNLAGSVPVPSNPTFDPLDPASYNNSQTVGVFDQSGLSHNFQTYFAKSSTANTYDVYFSLDKASISPSKTTSPVSLLFNPDGTQSPTSPKTIDFDMPANGSTFPISLDVSKLTQFGKAYQSIAVTQDGYGVGNFSGFSIEQDGKISAAYSNGQSMVKAQLSLANFINPEGLTRTNDGMYLESSASGQPTVGIPGSGALGVLLPASLESSNVDVASAMVDMITAQRNYQANAQAVKINDQIMQTLVSLR